MNLYLRVVWLFMRYRFRSRLSAWDTSITPFRVWPSDLDPLMHMNNGKYLSIMDLGRMDLMLRSGSHQAFTEKGWYPVVAGQTIAYYRSLNPWRHFTVHSSVMGLDDRWIYMRQDFVRDDVIYASAIVRARFLKRSGGSVSHDELEEVFGKVPQDRTVPDWVREWATHAKPSDR